LLAVCRRRADLAPEFAREFGAQRWYAGWKELLQDAEINAVYVATPVHLHAEQTIAAAEAGKHVLCEKPMALTSAQCSRMIAACRAAGVKLEVAYYRRFYPVLRRIREVLASGQIGVPVLTQINAFERFNPEPGEPRAWFLDPQLAGGGPMMDFGCHRIEVLLSLFGPIADVTGFTDNVLFRGRAVEDTAAAFFRFDGGPRAVLSVTHAAAESQDTLDIFCSSGSLHVSVLNRGDLRIVSEDGERREQHPPHRNLHQPLVEDFIAAVLADREPAVGGEMGRAVQEIEERIFGT
jgi:predicted dehydrogenase